MIKCKVAEVDQGGYKREFTAVDGYEIQVIEMPGGSFQIREYKGHPCSPSSVVVLAYVSGQSVITTHWRNE